MEWNNPCLCNILVANLVDRLMTRMVDLEGQTSYERMLLQERDIARVQATARKRIQLNTPVQSPAKAIGSSMRLETPESYHRKRKEAMEAAAEADRIAMLVTTGANESMISGYDNQEYEEEDDETIAAQYRINNEEDNANETEDMATEDPEDHDPSGTCG
jgi:hypothetical protein